MQRKVILQTARLTLSEFDYSDTQFIQHLVNTPKWLAFIGDRGVSSEADAITYLDNGPLKSYADNGFGLWKVELTETGTPIGMCGLINRDTLDDVDIGFAMLPEFAKKGYGFEIASATLSHAIYKLNLPRVLAITSPNNVASIRLLTKIGLGFVKTMISDDEKLLLFSNNQHVNEQKQIDQVTASFFDVFTNTDGKTPNVEELFDLFIEKGIIINNTKGDSETYSVDEFVQSRKEILNSGNLIGFSEREVSGNTTIFDGLASRFVFYEKSGVFNGDKFETKGIKTMQFVKIASKWKIASVVWNDE